MKNFIKKLLFLFIISVLFSCSSNTANKYKTAKLLSVYAVGSGNNKHERYHFMLTRPYSLSMSHDPVSLFSKKKRGKDFDLTSISLFTDSLGRVQGNKVLWDGRQLRKEVLINFEKKYIKISNFLVCDADGLCSRIREVEGIYPIMR